MNTHTQDPAVPPAGCGDSYWVCAGRAHPALPASDPRSARDPAVTITLLAFVAEHSGQLWRSQKSPRTRGAEWNRTGPWNKDSMPLIVQKNCTGLFGILMA